MKAMYIGDPRNPAEQKQLPDEFHAFGLTFKRGKFTDVPDRLASKFEGNSHYDTSGAKPKADGGGAETVPELAERIATVDDIEALKDELAGERRSTAKAALEARIAELEAAQQ